MDDERGPGTGGQEFPRSLTPLEGALLVWVLPDDAPGYAPIREFISRSSVIGQGRRGEGEIILGEPRDVPDLGAPLPAVVSYGVAEANGDEISVTVREILEGQLSVEIVGKREDRVPADARIGRKWTYAEWRPGMRCPQCSGPARQVELGRAEGRVPSVLAICPADRRIWVYDGSSGICRPVPVTNYYNELMLLKVIRDPAIALSSGRLFETLDRYSDADLAAAFAAYNRVRTKLVLSLPPEPAPPGRGIAGRLLGRIRDALRSGRHG